VSVPSSEMGPPPPLCASRVGGGGGSNPPSPYTHKHPLSSVIVNAKTTVHCSPGFSIYSFRSPAISVAKFIVPYWEDKVDYGIGLSYQPASLCNLMDRYGNRTSESTLSLSVRDYELGLWLCSFVSLSVAGANDWHIYDPCYLFQKVILPIRV
jgi:hypothetical protein